MKFKNYVVIGIAQGIAALPGVSRSGMTSLTMLLMGVKPEQALRLSYPGLHPSVTRSIFRDSDSQQIPGRYRDKSHRATGHPNRDRQPRQ